ncbi:MAG: hypothetical protein PW791_01900 [Neorhizobium sp.]|jgi:hypothetical protein|nr:hypothetical protein [Neorhizobium sp.]
MTTPSTKVFQRKIDHFCKMRLSGAFPPSEFEGLRGYLSMLIQTRRMPPKIGNRTDWASVSEFSGIEAGRLSQASKLIDPALDAIARFVKMASPKMAAPAATAAKPGAAKPTHSKIMPAKIAPIMVPAAKLVAKKPVSAPVTPVKPVTIIRRAA